jgi:hypothetical protein
MTTQGDNMKKPTKRQVNKFCKVRGIPLQMFGMMIASGRLTLDDFSEMVLAFHDPANKEEREEMEYEMAANRY